MDTHLVDGSVGSIATSNPASPSPHSASTSLQSASPSPQSASSSPHSGSVPQSDVPDPSSISNSDGSPLEVQTPASSFNNLMICEEESNPVSRKIVNSITTELPEEVSSSMKEAVKSHVSNITEPPSKHSNDTSHQSELDEESSEDYLSEEEECSIEKVEMVCTSTSSEGPVSVHDYQPTNFSNAPLTEKMQNQNDVADIAMKQPPEKTTSAVETEFGCTTGQEEEMELDMEVEDVKPNAAELAGSILNMSAEKLMGKTVKIMSLNTGKTKTSAFKASGNLTAPYCKVMANPALQSGKPRTAPKVVVVKPSKPSANLDRSHKNCDVSVKRTKLSGSDKSNKNANVVIVEPPSKLPKPHAEPEFVKSSSKTVAPLIDPQLVMMIEPDEVTKLPRTVIRSLKEIAKHGFKNKDRKTKTKHIDGERSLDENSDRNTAARDDQSESPIDLGVEVMNYIDLVERSKLEGFVKETKDECYTDEETMERLNRENEKYLSRLLARYGLEKPKPKDCPRQIVDFPKTGPKLWPLLRSSVRNLLSRFKIKEKPEGLFDDEGIKQSEVGQDDNDDDGFEFVVSEFYEMPNYKYSLGRFTIEVNRIPKVENFQIEVQKEETTGSVDSEEELPTESTHKWPHIPSRRTKKGRFISNPKRKASRNVKPSKPKMKIKTEVERLQENNSAKESTSSFEETKIVTRGQGKVVKEEVQSDFYAEKAVGCEMDDWEDSDSDRDWNDSDKTWSESEEDIPIKKRKAEKKPLQDPNRLKIFSPKLGPLPNVRLEDHPDKYTTESFTSIAAMYRGKSHEEKSYERFSCLVCNSYKTPDKESMETHLANHIDGRLSCLHCSFIACTRNALVAHRIKFHKGARANMVMCEHCGKDFGSVKLYKQHMGVVHGESRFRCKHCTQKFNTHKELKQHGLESHKGCFHQCTLCSRVFIRKVSLDSHIERKACQQVKIQCEHCGSMCATRASLSEHIKRVHTREHISKCKFCDYTTHKSCRMTDHMRAHLGVHPWKCHLCSFSCVKNYQLVSHMRIHTGEKKFKCSKCNYAAAWNVQLKTHDKVHSSSTAVECEQCNIMFKDQRCLSVHVNKEHSSTSKGGSSKTRSKVKECPSEEGVNGLQVPRMERTGLFVDDEERYQRVAREAEAQMQYIRQGMFPEWS